MTNSTISSAVGAITGSTRVGTTPQSHVTVELLNGPNLVATTTTDADGIYNFSGIPTGYYQVLYLTPSRETIQSGPADLMTGKTATIGVTAGSTRTLATVTFKADEDAAAGAVAAAAMLSGLVDYAGAGQGGVAVALIGVQGNVVASTTTSAAGAFNFMNLAAGSYQVRYTAPTGEALNYGGSANVLSGLTAAVSLTGGQALSVPTQSLVANQNDVGVYINWPGVSNYDSSLSAYSATVSAAPTHIDSGVDYTQTLANWVGNAQAAAGHLRATTDGTTIIPDIAVPLISAIGNGQTEMQNFSAITNGADDSVWLGIVNAYKAEGYTTIDLRIGWEQNGNWYPWSISTEAEAQAYIAAFDHISTLVHDVAGIKVNVVWNPAEVDRSAVPTADMYPGNKYVDVIGLDLYDSLYPLSLYDWSTHTFDSSLAQWEANPVNLAHYWSYPDANQANPTGSGAGFGLVDAMQFAAANGKPFALPEIGAGGSSTSIADDAAFPEYLASMLLASGAPKIAFANIWDSGTYTFSDGSKPAEAAAWADFVKKLAQGDSGSTPTASSVSVAARLTGTVQLAGAGVSGVTVSAVNEAGGITTTTTGSDGGFAFTGLEPGTYQVKYTAPSGEMLQSGPANGSTGLTNAVTLAAGQSLALATESLAPVKPAVTPAPATLTGSVLFAGAGQPGVAVALQNGSGVVIATTATDANGAFSFANLAAGSYALAYTAPTGEKLQSGDPANTTTGVTGLLTLVAGQTLAAAPEHVLVSAVSLLMSGKNVTLTEGNAPFIVTGAPSGSKLTLGNADQNVTLGGFSNTVTLGNGNDIVSLSGPTQILHVGDGSQALTLTGNFDTVTLGNTPSGQSSVVTANGTGDTISGGNGDISVTGPAGSSTVTLGNGDDTVTLTGSHNTITVGTGTSVINAGSNSEIIHAAGGNVTVTVGGQSNLVDIGPGAGVINAGSASRMDIFILNGINQGLTLINGFTTNTGDVLDLKRTLAGTGVNGTLSNIGRYVTATTAGGNTTLSVDPTGGHAPGGAFATLTNTTVTVSQLVAAHAITLS